MMSMVFQFWKIFNFLSGLVQSFLFFDLQSNKNWAKTEKFYFMDVIVLFSKLCFHAKMKICIKYLKSRYRGMFQGEIVFRTSKEKSRKTEI